MERKPEPVVKIQIDPASLKIVSQADIDKQAK